MAAMRSETKSSAAVAVVGASALFPGSIGAQSFWRNILEGRDFMSDVPADNWIIDDFFDPDPAKPGKIYARRGAFLPKVDFDPIAHGLPPNQLSTTDTVQLLSLIVAQKVLDDAASVQFGTVKKQDISVILGVGSGTELMVQMSARIQRPNWIKALREAGLPETKVQDVCDRIEATYPQWDESTFPGLLGNVVAGRIANRLDLGGANCAVDAACASSLGAVAMAVQELRLGHSELVITGGADCLNDTFMYMCFAKTLALSPTGDCRPFSESADGTMLGEGIGMLALRRLEDAERDGDRIYAVLRGIGSSSDGRAKSIYAPRWEGQETAIRRAYQRAGYGPGEVGLVEAHGTATKAGDLAEFAGLRSAFAEVEARQVIALGSVKSQIGHTKAAAGAASLLKVVMALHHKVLPPTIKVDKPNTKLNIQDSPFYLNTESRPWVQAPGATRKASVSSFGFGGSNFHATLEEYAGPGASALRAFMAPIQLVLIEADDAQALMSRAKDLCADLTSAGLPHLARESQLAFVAGTRHRLAVLAADAETAIAVLRRAVAQISRDADKPFSLTNRTYYAVGGERPKIAFLFPGQGSQYLHMGRALAIEFDAARRVWDEAAGRALDGDALHEVVFPVPAFDEETRATQAKRLTCTEWAQPALGAASLAVMEVMRQAGVAPDAVAGHSYGEVVALHAAGMIESPADMLAISRRRGELMRDAASEPGAMMAVGVSRSEVEALVKSHAPGIAIASINSPTQVVVAGPSELIGALQAVLKQKGTPYTRLPVATAFHTALVASSSEPFAAFLAGQALAAPRIPVYSNSRAEPYGRDADGARVTLAQQLAQPVLFADMIERMYADGCRLFVEVGAGSALTGMVNDCLAGRPHTAVATDHRKQDGVAALLNALAVISTCGVEVDFAAFWAPFAPFEPRQKAPLSPAAVKLGGANYGKPYPAGGSATLPPPLPEHPPRETPVPLRSAHPLAFEAQAKPTAAPLPAASVAGAAGPSDSRWAAFELMQKNLLEAQKTFTETIAASHLAFLRASEAGISQLAGGAVTSMVAVPASPPVAVAAQIAIPVSIPASKRAVTNPQTPIPVAESTPVIAKAPSRDAEALLLEVVAEKTGYPVEMLRLDMELEAGLGIDSIKRVQILSALQEKMPELASVDATALAALNTLGEIVAFANSGPGVVAPASPPVEVAAPIAIPVSVPASKRAVTNPQIPIPVAESTPVIAKAPSRDAEALLLEVVAEKTGYPVEMLRLDMELEAGLGIDSIKRVQILSALQEKMPELALVDATALAALNTLGEIVAFANSGPGVVASRAPIPAKPRIPTMERASVEIVEAAPSSLVTPGLLGNDIVWLAGGPPEVASALARTLARAGITAEPVGEAPASAQAVIVLSALEPASDAAYHAALNERVFCQIRACAQAMAQGGRLLVTVQATGGDFGLTCSGPAAWSAGICAAAKTAALEWPHVSVKAIDVARGAPELLAERIATELLAGGAELEVGLAADGRRLRRKAVTGSSVRPVTAAFPSDGVLVVSGGARGVTASCLEALLVRQPARVAILGRTLLRPEPEGLAGLTRDADLKRARLHAAAAAGRKPTPHEIGAEVREILTIREIKANLGRLAATGAEVRYIIADVADAAAVKAAVEDIRASFGPVRGLVHAAGVLADKEIRLKTPEQVRKVMAVKVDGLRNLLDATRHDALTHIVCFSSVAAWHGNIGQIDYAMANEVLNGVCRAERAARPGCLVKAIAWGPWAGGMVDAGLQARFAALGVGLIPLPEGADFFADVFQGLDGEGPEVLFGGGLSAFGAPPPDLRDARTFEARFHRATHPWIASHVIRGRPVVPLTAAHDLAVEAVRRWLPDAPAGSTTKIHVEQGMPLTNFESRGDVFRIECRRNGDANRIAVRILCPDEALAYRMEVQLGAGAALKSAPIVPKAWPAGRTAYDGRLFHGPALRVIERVDGLDRTGVTAVLRSPHPAPIGAAAPVDVLDGGLQLAALWAHEHLGKESLPTAIGALRLLRPWPAGRPVRCEAALSAGGKLVTEWTLSFLDDSGELLAVVEGLKMHVLTTREVAAPSLQLLAEST
jgi:acyl transferase domain-containing protein/acyl carrier protein